VEGHLEIEQKFDAEAGFTVPDLRGAEACTGLTEPATYHLRAVYFDTVDLRLAARKITLRRRTGGIDAGWHLKLPAGAGAKQEIHVPLDQTDEPADATHPVPPQLAALVAAHTRGRALVPIAELATRRVERDLVDDTGLVLAKAADDEVTARRLGVPEMPEPAPSQTWREIEIELVAGSAALLKAVGKRLRRSGARPAASGSKLGRLLGDTDRPPDATAAGDTIGSALVEYLRAQVTQLLLCDPIVRLADHDDDSVHQMRVATRRVRSSLRTHRRMLKSDPVAELDAEMRWLAGELGKVRDLEVMQARFRALMATLPQPLPESPDEPRWLAELAAHEQQARDTLRACLLTARYFAVLDTLDAFVADPPLASGADTQSAEKAGAVVAKAWKRMDRAYRRAMKPAGPDRDEALHDLRKAAKRARYAAEAAADVLGPAATDAAKRAAGLQTVLGTYHDGIVARQYLRKVAMRRGTARTDIFTLGLLAGIEECEAAETLGTLPSVWQQAAPPPAIG
jgi:CHAD domain-containing protein